jgi:lysophospholipase L1-like esterase
LRQAVKEHRPRRTNARSAAALAALIALAPLGCRSTPNHEASGPNQPLPIRSAPPEPRPSAPLVLLLPGASGAADTAALASTEPPAGAESLAPSQPRREPSQPRRVLVIGDSLSDSRAGGGGYLRALLLGCPAVFIDNRARGGWMVNQMRRRMEKELTPDALARFTDLILFGGVNDVYSDQTAGRTFEKITSDLAAMYERAKAANLRVIAVTLSPWGGFTSFYNASRARTTHRINDWIAEQRTTGLVDVVIDANRLLACGDPERLCPAYAHPIKDGLHFGAKGHARLGEALIERAFPECSAPEAIRSE